MMRAPVLAAIALVLTSFAGPGPADAAERVVQARAGALISAIEKAEAGDVLRLQPGLHQGPIVLDKPLTLAGVDGARIDGGGSGSVVTIDAPDSAIIGLTLTGSGLSLETLDAGVKLTQKATRAEVRDNRILNNLVGVDVHGAHDAHVARNLIEGRQDLRVNERGNGLYVWNAPGLVAEYNTIRHGRDGVFVNTSHKDTFRGNRFENLRFAVHYMYGNDGEIIGNLSTGNDIGYALMFSDGLVVRDNASIGDRNHGLMLNFANNAVITGNLVRNGGEKCLFMYNSNKNQVSGNRFEHCIIGIHFTAGSERNTFSDNAFIANQTQVKYVGSRNLDWSKAGRGNYWSDHAAFDTNGDGIADTAFRPNDMIDQILWTQPAAKLLVGSPAVQLLRWTQSQFPALLPGGVVDTAPLMRPPEVTPPNAGVNG
ncbi:nitrous oxidase accessory protein [Breoghania corrubedonensis]|uniref:Nitrous oxidase accessory protein n=1 Tax=Breoghania corrubedonensis TaxID=665038 RepID=A0A2T5V9V6_9HYPH|nr:nitrous oxide reductase family maturation protein NosD [Breoghania corrubedonensis]PTW60542.1 nitrous oxidase accessory protein [Breoghania corrubedonensis]